MTKLIKWFNENVAFFCWGKYWKGIYIHCIHPKYCVRVYLWGWDYFTKAKHVLQSRPKVVFTNGCFDILHRGHIELLKFCKARGRVIVGLNSDQSVRYLKGEKRPVFSQEDRKNTLLALKYVDHVIIFDEPTPYSLIKALRPDEIVKGGDYKIEDVAGHDIAPVVLFPYDPTISSTKALEKLNY